MLAAECVPDKKFALNLPLPGEFGLFSRKLSIDLDNFPSLCVDFVLWNTLWLRPMATAVVQLTLQIEHLLLAGRER